MSIVATHIELRENRRGSPRAYIVGTRVRVHDIYVLAKVQGKTPEEIVAAVPSLSLAQVHAALSYYFDHRDAILRELQEDQAFASGMRKRLGPGPLEQRLGGEAGDAAVPLG